MGLNRIAKFKGSKQDSLNLGARKPKGLNMIDKIREQQKNKGLNRIYKIWEQENQRA
jgi:hypothetical protein